MKFEEFEEKLLQLPMMLTKIDETGLEEFFPNYVHENGEVFAEAHLISDQKNCCLSFLVLRWHIFSMLFKSQEEIDELEADLANRGINFFTRYVLEGEITIQ